MSGRRVTGPPKKNLERLRLRCSGLHPRPDVTGCTRSRGELGQVSELQLVRAHVGDPTLLKVGVRGALMNGDLHDGVALRDTPATAALAGLTVLRAVEHPVYLVVEMSTFDVIPDVGSAGGARAPGRGCRPLLLGQWNT